jgi:hypothetical protein
VPFATATGYTQLRWNSFSHALRRADKHGHNDRVFLNASGGRVNNYNTEAVTEEPRDLGWRAYQPTWTETIAYSVSISGLYGGLSYYRTGNPVALEVTAAAAIPVCAFVRWIYPMFHHLRGGGPE